MIIFSVEQANVSDRENLQANEEATDLLNRPYVMTGVYKGQTEVSYMTSQVKLGKQLSKDFNQDCYLERGHYGVWYLIETKSDKILDTFKTIKEVTKDVALRSEYYSILNGKYYLASKY